MQQFFLLHGSALTALREHWSAHRICFRTRKLSRSGRKTESTAACRCALSRAFGRGRLSELAYDTRRGWLSPTEQPVERVREYFGEKIALYFVFVGNHHN